MLDHENRVVVTVVGPTKKSVDDKAVEGLVELGYSPSGYPTKAEGKPKLHHPPTS